MVNKRIGRAHPPRGPIAEYLSVKCVVGGTLGLLGVDAQDAASRELGYTLWALTHGLVSLELSHASRSPLAHPVLAETDAHTVLDTALRATLAGWRHAGAPT